MNRFVKYSLYKQFLFIKLFSTNNIIENIHSDYKILQNIINDKSKVHLSKYKQYFYL